MGVVGMYPLISGETVASTATVTGSWVAVPSGFSFGVWLTAAATGDSQLTLVLDVSPYDAAVLNATTAAATQYVSSTLVTDTTGAEGAMLQYDPAILGVPCQAVRAKLTGGSSNPADTVATVLLTRFMF